MKALNDTKQFYENALREKDSLIDKLKLEVLDFTEQRFNRVDSKIRSHDSPDARIRDLN